MLRRGYASGCRWLADVEASAAKRGTLYCELEDALHAHETGFFRFPPHHRLLANVVLPSLIRVGGPRVRILEVGCATGENAYSLAMTVRESAPRAAPSAVEVLAVDWSRPALVTGVRGVYPRARTGAVPPPWLARYFVAGAGGVAVGPTLREMVRFRHLDIRRAFHVGSVDVVVACDALVHFTPEVRRQVLARLSASLAAGGYLCLGPADGVTAPADLFHTVEPGGGVYRRRAGAGRGDHGR
jgi:chemotaxis methyl-accepting protein methylase